VRTNKISGVIWKRWCERVRIGQLLQTCHHHGALNTLKVQQLGVTHNLRIDFHSLMLRYSKKNFRFGLNVCHELVELHTHTHTRMIKHCSMNDVMLFGRKLLLLVCVCDDKFELSPRVHDLVIFLFVAL